MAASFGKEGWNSQIVDVAYWSGQFVALGVSEEVMSDSQDHAMWVSEDGRRWTMHSITLPGQTPRPRKLVPFDDGRLAILGAVVDASETPGTFVARAWESRDLREWLTSDLGIPEPSATAHAVAYGPRGYVAAVGSALWFAADGVAWEPAADHAARGLAAGGEGFVAVGSAGPAVARIDASGDGVSWYTGDTLPEPITVGAVGPGEWVAAGGQPEYEVWRSEDGLTWLPTTTVEQLSGWSAGPGIQTAVTEVRLVTVDEVVYMSLSWNHCCAQLSGGRGLWQSEDGLTWDEVAFEEGAVVQAGATDGDTVVLAGLRGRGTEGVLWATGH